MMVRLLDLFGLFAFPSAGGGLCYDLGAPLEGRCPGFFSVLLRFFSWLLFKPTPEQTFSNVFTQDFSVYCVFTKKKFVFICVHQKKYVSQKKEKKTGSHSRK